MKIVFLDFDGVINPLTFTHHGSGFSKVACENLQSILDKEPSLRIVVSSSWRRNGLDMIRSILKENGIDSKKVIDLTDEVGGWMPWHRGEQIERWLKANPSVKKFLILDDFPIPKFDSNAVKTNGYIGLTKKDIEIALRILAD